MKFCENTAHIIYLSMVSTEWKTSVGFIEPLPEADIIREYQSAYRKEVVGDAPSEPSADVEDLLRGWKGGSGML